jgi:TonB-dependent starch-binding outer membrane protein SusC
MITTRAGKKGDRSTVNLEMGYTVQSVTKKMKLMNPRQYAEFYNEQAKNDGLSPYFTQQTIDSLGGVAGTDWQDLVLRSEPIYNTNVTVNGGSDKTRFSISGGAFLQEGIVPNSNFNRYSFRTNLRHDISKAVNVSNNTTLTRITRK